MYTMNLLAAWSYTGAASLHHLLRKFCGLHNMTTCGKICYLFIKTKQVKVVLVSVNVYQIMSCSPHCLCGQTLRADGT